MKNLIISLILGLTASSSHVFGADKSAEGQTQFALDLYKAISKQPGNIIFSPYSISIALAMTATGADGTTLSEMKKSLHLTDNFSEEYKKLLANVLPSKENELLIANRIWLNEGKTYSSQFSTGLKTYFGADIMALDFRTKTEPSRVAINNWVEEKTKKKINDLIPPDAITDKTDLALTNAIYFKGAWEEKFNPENTIKNDFFISKSKKVSAEFMNITTKKFGYFKDVDAQILTIPYKGREVNFIIALPNDNIKMADLEKSLTSDRLRSWMQVRSQAGEVFVWKQPGLHPLPPGEVSLAMPRFKMGLPLNLVPTLKSLGIADAFDRRRATFTKIRASSADENIFITDVIHKAFVEVNEEGTEAAAATAVVSYIGAAPSQWTPFFANRPFLFFIHHVPTNSILFMGRLSHP